MRRKILSFLLALTTIITLLPVQALAADTDNPFRDINQGDWFYDAVQYVRVNGFFSGTTTTTFSPDETMTRGMFVTVLGRMVGVDTSQYQGESAFGDVREDEYYAPYIAWASKHGIALGTGEGNFSPGAFINREQMAAFFTRYFEAFGVEYETGKNITTRPADIDSVSDYARESVLSLWQQGLLNGDGVNFNPGDSAARSQTAMVCYRMDLAVQTWFREPGVASDRVKIDPATGLPFGEEPEETGEPEAPPKSEAGGGSGSRYHFVYFYDGKRLIERLMVKSGEPLGKLPSVSKSSKEGSILEGYYLDSECTVPFYAEEPVTGNTSVYAKYEELEPVRELLTIDSFALMDQDPDVTFRFKSVGGSAANAPSAVSLAVKDGSAPVEIAVSSNGDGTYTVGAVGGFNEGCSYELNLKEGWAFLPSGDDAVENDSIRTAAFSIFMEEVENLRMNADIVYIQDTDAISYSVGGQTVSVLTNDMELTGGGSFSYSAAAGLDVDDILCIYVGDLPDTEGRSPSDPAVYVKVSGVDGSTVSFEPLGAEDQVRLYDIPDNFPIHMDRFPGETGTVNISQLDANIYRQMVGDELGTPDKARAALSEGDFVSIFTDSIGSESDLYFGLVTEVDSDGTIHFTRCTAEDIRRSGDVYKHTSMDGDDLITDEEKAEIERTVQAQVENSGFGEEAAYTLLEMASQTDSFKNTAGLREVLIRDGEGNELTSGGVMDIIRSADAKNVGTSFKLSDKATVKVELITSGSQLHYSSGVQLAIGVEADFEVDTADDGKVHINLSATFVQEVAFSPTVKGGLVYKEILFIPVPVGVQVTTNIDVKSFSAMSVKAEIFTEGPEDKNFWEKFQSFAKDPTSLGSIPGVPDEIKKGLKTVGDALKEIDELKDEVSKQIEDLPLYNNYISDIWKQVEKATNGRVNRSEWEQLGEQLERTDITEELMNLANFTGDTGLTTEYIDSLSALMDRYSDMLAKETDWVQLVDKEMFNYSSPQYLGVMVGVQGKFVVRADLNLAIGSNLQYEVGKRYSFWFRVGLFEPSSGSSSMDLIDESFAFQFYVMGKIGVKAGVRLKLYAAIGSVDAISVGITTELGPYVKLWGFFIYDYSKLRRANTPTWATKEQMAGALYLEFGLYLMVGMEAKALFLEYDKDFVDKEYPLLSAGDKRYYYDIAYEPADDTDEIVVYNNGTAYLQPGCVISMVLPEYAHSMKYLDLTTGAKGIGSPGAGSYYAKLSNPNFRVDVVNGEMVVSITSIPEGVRVMQCDLTLTYKRGKLAFSSFDLITTVHLAWTDLTPEEYQQFFNASVAVPDGKGGRTVVWSKRVHKGAAFDLPDESEIRRILSWNDAKYTAGAGYGGQKTTGLVIMQDQQYSYDMGYQSYSLTVTGIEGRGSPVQTFTGRYGEPIDFSALLKTGADGPYEFTRFAGAIMNGENVDLTQPVSGSFAEAIRDGATAQAQYVDDSATATFTFTGAEIDDIPVRLRRGGQPDISRPFYAVQELEDVVIMGFYPSVGPTEGDTVYEVVCGAPIGVMAEITYETNKGSEVSADLRVSGSILGLLPTYPANIERYGYDFEGWFLDGETFEQEATVNTMVTGPMTLYAKWEPVQINVTFNAQEGVTPDENVKTVTFDDIYGELPETARTAYRFLGWWTEPDGEGEEITEDTIVRFDDDITLYAYWKPRIDLYQVNDGDLFDVEKQTRTYKWNTTYTIKDLTSYYSQIPGLEDYEGTPVPDDGFNFVLESARVGDPADGKAHNFGTYRLRIYRDADYWYEYYEKTYDILVIEKAKWADFWREGNFRVTVKKGKDNDRIMVDPPRGFTDLPDSITNGIVWATNTEGRNEDNEINGPLEMDGDEASHGKDSTNVKIWIVFTETSAPAGAYINYELPYLSEFEGKINSDSKRLNGGWPYRYGIKIYDGPIGTLIDAGSTTFPR